MNLDAVPGLNVSRETIEKLQLYQKSLQKWNGHINLISRDSVKDSWQRHVVDSSQLFPMVQEDAKSLVDLGSGAGFPGLVTAIIAQEQRPTLKVTMVEADQRKCTFLRTILRETNTDAEVVVARIEELPGMKADVLSARALAPLDKLFKYAKKHRKLGGSCLFLKGETWLKEVEEARRLWTFDLIAHKSVTDPRAAILEIGTFDHV